jgi:hypothetical protein
VDSASAFEVDLFFEKWLVVTATGTVASSGWTNPQLAPVFYVVPPADGIWDFEFVASEPSGVVCDVVLPVAGHWEGRLPGWPLNGVRIRAADGQDVVVRALSAGKGTLKSLAARLPAGSRFERTIAVYDDSFQPTGTIHWSGHFPPVPHVEMKKLRHELTIVADGPDEDKIRRCIDTSLQAGALAAIIAAFASGGWAAAEAFVSGALGALETCLGQGFGVKLSDHSHWIYWDT